jgi:hypothetical protein
MRLSASLVALGALCLCLGACEPEETEGIADPMAPGAVGLIEVAAGTELGELTTLEIRAFAAASDTGDDSVFRDIPDVAHGVRSVSIPVDAADFPLQFKVGADGIGAIGSPYLRVVAWLARGAGSSVPDADAPWGTAIVALSDCSFACEGTCYCGLALANADILLAPSH